MVKGQLRLPFLVLGKQMEPIIILQGTSVKELLSQISSLISNRLSEHMELQRPPNPNKYLTRKEAASLLKITLPTLHEWTKMGWLTSYRIGNRVLYKEQELESALVSRKLKFR